MIATAEQLKQHLKRVDLTFILKYAINNIDKKILWNRLIDKNYQCVKYMLYKEKRKRCLS